eukprot:95924-Hanusia_phi.AAC.2
MFPRVKIEMTGKDQVGIDLAELCEEARDSGMEWTHNEIGIVHDGSDFVCLCANLRSSHRAQTELQDALRFQEEDMAFKVRSSKEIFDEPDKTWRHSPSAPSMSCGRHSKLCWRRHGASCPTVMCDNIKNQAERAKLKSEECAQNYLDRWLVVCHDNVVTRHCQTD